MSVDTDRRSSWSRYWATGALHSCGSSFADNYDGEIAQFWISQLRNLRPQARVLDLATGNGALPRLFLEHSPIQSVEIDAVDLAAVSPQWPAVLPAEARARLRFHQGVRAEQLPFPPASFDLVSSQYGLEYTDLQASVAEILRVLAVHGRVALVMHHEDSLPVTLGRREMASLDWLLCASGLMASAEKLVVYMARLGTQAGLDSVRTDPDAAKARADFDIALRALDQQGTVHGQSTDVLTDARAELSQILSGAARVGLDRAREALAMVPPGWRESRLRQQELVKSALSRDEIDALSLALCHGREARSQISTVNVRSHLFAWTLEIGPAPAVA